MDIPEYEVKCMSCNKISTNKDKNMRHVHPVLPKWICSDCKFKCLLCNKICDKIHLAFSATKGVVCSYCLFETELKDV